MHQRLKYQSIDAGPRCFTTFTAAPRPPPNTFPTRSRAAATRPPRQPARPPRDLRPSRGRPARGAQTPTPILAGRPRRESGSGHAADVRPVQPSTLPILLTAAASTQGRLRRRWRDGLRPPL